MTTVSTTVVTPTQALDAAFSGVHCEVVRADGSTRELAVHRWRGDADEADYELFVRRCHGRTLDVGCGPGRLTAALAASAVLGIDVSREAIRQARVRGANVLRHNAFDRLPGSESWDHVLLADGNIGIGGDPVRMLRRAAQLAGSAPRGRVLAELEAGGTGVSRQLVRLRVDARLTEPFGWATVGVDAIDAVAAAAGLCVEGVAYAAGRCVATLVASGRWG